MSTHIPGPWVNNGGVIGPEGCTSDEAVCIVGTVNEQSVQDTANARLITGARYLLIVCEMWDEFFSVCPDGHPSDTMLSMTAEAIADAKGA